MTQVSHNYVSPDQEVVIERAANKISRRGFRMPALALFESGPLVPFLSSQLLWVAQPALSFFIPTQKIRQAAELLESPKAVSILIEYLHVADETRDS